MGLARNFNQVFRLSSGEFFKWAAYDDICGPHLLSRCVEVLDRDPGVVLAYPRVAMIDEDGQTTTKNDPGPDMTSLDHAVRLSTLMRHPFWATSMFGLIRSSVLARTGLMRSNAACDHVLLAELCLHGRFVEVPEYDFFNRDHPDRAITKSSIIQRGLYVDPSLPRVGSVPSRHPSGGLRAGRSWCADQPSHSGALFRCRWQVAERSDRGLGTRATNMTFVPWSGSEMEQRQDRRRKRRPPSDMDR